MHVGEKTQEIWDLHESGISLKEIAERYQISESSVLKRLRSYERLKEGYYKSGGEGHKHVSDVEPVWSKEKIKVGFERFLLENGRLPTASEVDEYEYLPTARSIQRSFGGLVKLREELGYDEHHFGKGEYRVSIAKRVGKRGFDAEDHLEKILVLQFGEIYVHVQKGYGSGRSRFDFVVYARGHTIGIDVFSSDSRQNIQKNIHLKLKKYADAPSDVEKFFVVYPEGDIADSMELITGNMASLTATSVKVLFIDEFVKYLEGLEPLVIPEDFVSYFDDEESIN